MFAIGRLKTGKQICSLVLVFGTLYHSFGVGVVGAAPICGPFHHNRQTVEALLNQYKPALLRLTVGKMYGTGFLVDQRRGYVMTAYHLIKPTIMNKTLKIVGQSSRYPGRTLKLEVLDKDLAADTALLQLIPESALSDTRPFELGLDVPPANSVATLYGYQLGDDEPLSEQGRISGIVDGKLHMRVNTFPGDSGSPIFNDRGIVIGVVTDKKFSGISVIASTIGFDGLISKNSRSAISESIYNNLMNDTVPADFHMQLDPKSPPNTISNLDLIGLMRQLNKHKSLSKKKAVIVHCPIYFAALHRELSYGARWITHLLSLVSISDAARLEFKIGSVLDVFGRSVEAQATFTKAVGKFQIAIGDRISKHPALATQILCDFTSMRSDAIRAHEKITEIFASIGVKDVRIPKKLGKEKCGWFPYDKVLAALVRDMTLARLRLIDLSTGGADPSMVAFARRGAAFASLVSETKTAFGANLALLGDASMRSRDFWTALLAYAGAWQIGSEVQWVKTNFKTAGRDIRIQSGIEDIMLAEDISSATTVTIRDLKDIIEYTAVR